MLWAQFCHLPEQIYVLVSLFVNDERYPLSKDVVSVMVLVMHSTLRGTFLHSLEWKCLNQPHFLYSSLLSSNVCTLLLFIFHEFPSLYLLTSPFLLYKISLVLFHIFNSLNHYLLIQLNFRSSSIFFPLIIFLPPWNVSAFSLFIHSTWTQPFHKGDIKPLQLKMLKYIIIFIFSFLFFMIQIITTFALYSTV